MSPHLPRRAAFAAVSAIMALLWVLDVLLLQSAATLHERNAWWQLLPGVVAGVALLLPDGRRSPLAWRAGTAALLSLVTTSLMLAALPTMLAGWGLLESWCLLLLLARTAREVARPWLSVALCTALAAAVIAAPMRVADINSVVFSFLLTFLASGAVGLGCYLRGLDARRRRAIADVRQSERLALARELHDFVAHHVTGIVVQAQAAQTIRETSPEQIDPLLRGIEQAGSQTLESMRKLVRVLRDDDARMVRPGELYAELAEMVAAFSERDAPATLQVSAGAREARPDPEVETSVRNVVREALTNVRRHAPGAPSVAVRVGLADGPGGGAGRERLCIQVHNAAPPRGAPANAEPLGGRGGLGLVGLTERAEAVGGTLRANRAEDGGWRLTAELPLRGAVPGSTV